MEAMRCGVGIYGEEETDLRAATLKFADRSRRLGGRSRPLYQ